MKKLWASMLFVVLWVIVPALSAWWFLNPEDSHVNGFITPPDEEMLNYVLAIVCYFWMSLNLILSARIKIIERLAPLNVRILAHILMTIGVFVSFTYHAIFKIIVKPEIDFVSWSLLALFYLAIILALSWTPVKGFMWFPRFRMLGYEVFRRIHHVLMLLILVLMVVHLYAAHVFEFSQLVPNLVFWSYGILALLAFGSARLQGKLGKKAVITGLKSTSELVRIELTFDIGHRFNLGQFIYLRSSATRELRAYHPFSIIESSGTSISLLVNAKGRFTKSLARLSLGSEVQVNGSFGSFFKTDHQGNLVFIGTGSGVGVLCGMVKNLIANNYKHDLICLFSLSPNDYFMELEELLQSNLGNLKLIIRSHGGAYFDQQTLKGLITNTQSAEAYICTGPKNASKFKKLLKQSGLKRRNIHFEKFHY